jgi:FRG domain-containing protein
VVDQQPFFTETIESWDHLVRTVRQLSDGRWLYRGQAHDWCLKSTLQRSIEDWSLNLSHAPALEDALIREFRRRVRGEEHSFIKDDVLNCLALMRHHGAPTRLLDCTYSPFVAAQCALREGLNAKHCPVIWCFSADWMEKHCEQVLGQTNRRTRFDTLRNQTPALSLVMHDNPEYLSQRLTTHQGAFLCPGDISKPFVQNLKEMTGCNLADNLRKLRLCFARKEGFEAIKTLKRMNVSSTVLFPGLDGFARSLGEELPFYDETYGGD